MYANNLLEGEKVTDYTRLTDPELPAAIKEESLLSLGYFLMPHELFSAITAIGNNHLKNESNYTQILNYINKGNIFERAKILRDRVPYTNERGETRIIELINQIHWCQNQYQVIHQIAMEGRYKNRYDVTLLVNGLPLVQIEPKRRGLALKEAFNQINRYERHSFGAGQGLFQFVQIFVISYGVNTKYYANSPIKARSFRQFLTMFGINH